MTTFQIIFFLDFYQKNNKKIENLNNNFYIKNYS